ncbi:MAG: cytochrome P450 [Chloroflexi bacterium]|nr:cytochrome P450 [Chloroflexota bacterium]MCI0575882.1 cytochrome P450 [Chloroflexota bacterium]MCI0648560.1 cytochrome P450 [Chloroflexota bacterium]MCI0727323.1 cytochrome P450 [Chloroflexota bacterium]
MLWTNWTAHAHKSLIPGPKGRPLRGSLADFQQDPLQLLVDSAREYGDVVRLRMGPRDFYLISNPEYIQEILVTKQQDFHKVRPPGSSQFLGNGLLRSEGDFHLRQRRLAQPAFHRQRLAAYGRTMVERTEQLLATWQDGQVRDIHEEMMRLTLVIVGETLFGADISDETSEIGQALTEAMLWFNRRIGSPLALPEKIPTPANRRFQKALGVLDRIVYDLIQQRRASGADAGDLLSMLLLAQDEEGGTDSMSDEQLRDEVMTLLLAGHETTANTLSWTWYLLSRYPEVRARLETELNMVLDGRSPTVDDLPNLAYIEMVLQESLRLYPPAWTQARQLADEWQCGPYRLPADSVALFSQYVMHRHPAYWPNPEGFDPERFNPELPANRPRFAYFPFGAGRRQCIGQSFAMMEARLITAAIAQKARLNLIPGFPVEPHPLVTLRPKYGVKMRIQMR